MSRSLYFLIYTHNSRKDELSLREPTINSKDFIKMRGKRVGKIFNDVMSVLNAYSLKFSISRSENKVIVELPADVGYAVLVYLLLVYGAKEPGKWLYFLEDLLAGKIPLSKYLNMFVDMAVDLSSLDHNYKHRGIVIKPGVAKLVSSMMRMFVKNLR